MYLFYADFIFRFQYVTLFFHDYIDAKVVWFGHLAILLF